MSLYSSNPCAGASLPAVSNALFLMLLFSAGANRLFSMALICTTRHRIPASASANQGSESDDLIPVTGASLPAVSNALFLMLLFSMIYAILGVQFFKEGQWGARKCAALQRTVVELRTLLPHAFAPNLPQERCSRAFEIVRIALPDAAFLHDIRHSRRPVLHEGPPFDCLKSSNSGHFWCFVIGLKTLKHAKSGYAALLHDMCHSRRPVLQRRFLYSLISFIYSFIYLSIPLFISFVPLFSYSFLYAFLYVFDF